MSDAATSPTFFIHLVNGYRSAKVVFVAHGLGVFEQLEGKERSALELAGALSLDRHALTVLLRALVAIGVLREHEGRFTNAPLASACLVKASPSYLGHNLTYQELLWPAWSKLDEVVRTGQPMMPLEELLSRGPENFAFEYLKSVDYVSRKAAAAMTEVIDASAMSRMLDVGGGLGTYARAFAERFEPLEVTLFDLPATLRHAEQALASSKAAGRIRLREGNYLRDELGDGFDLVLFSHVTHDESSDTNRELFRKAHRCLKPGGWVAIHDYVVDPNGCGPLFETLFSVNMLVYTRGGQVYSERDYQELLREAGLEPRRSHRLLEGQVSQPTTLLLAQKPSR